MRRCHEQKPTASRGRTASESGAVKDLMSVDPNPVSRPQNPQMGSMDMMPGSRKRTSTQIFDTDEMTARKKQRSEECGSNIDIEGMTREEALTREVEKLRAELEKAQREKDVLIGVIDRLNQGQK